MKNKRIILVRHGLSQANVDKEIHKTLPDYAIRLTETGCNQALERGAELAKLEGDFSFYCSPYWRARDTYQGILEGGKLSRRVRFCYEDSRLREQEWGIREDLDKVEEERDSVGHYYYRFLNGESCADVENRISSFLNTLIRDLQKDDAPENAVIVTHGMTMRVFLKRFFHLSVEEFELLKNPPNCGIYTLEKIGDKYSLANKPEQYQSGRSKFVYSPFINSHD